MATRINDEQVGWVVKQMCQGVFHKDIATEFKKLFQRNISPSTLARINERNLTAINEARQIIAKDATTSAIRTKHKLHELMEHRVDDALEDYSDLRALRKQFQNGEINEVEYKRKRDLYEQLTMSEIVKTSEALHSQTKGEDTDPVGPQDQAALAALIAGIQAGNPVQLIQVLTDREGSPSA